MFQKLAYISLGLGLMIANKASACAPPPNATYTDPADYRLVAGSSAVFHALDAAGGEDVKLIVKIGNGTFRVSASNDCYVDVKVERTYKQSTHIGMCPIVETEMAVVTGSGCVQTPEPVAAL